MTKAGKIVCFYSYKGGTGRTMALSNVAWVLASNGCKVLLIDWDLEAPGLHRYLRPFLVDPELASTPGLIDFAWDAARVNMTPVEAKGPSSPAEFPSLEDYVVGLDWDFKGRGSIAFIPAGRQDATYAQRVNTFDWDIFYERLGGGKLLQAEREALRANYDYILIDSRTGVSDTSGICTVHMPDSLVVFFTLNRQSIVGAAAVATSVQAQRGESFPVFPVPTRIELAETSKLDLATAYARRIFAPLLLHVQSDRSEIDLRQQAQYWKDVETPYIPFYAYEEVPAAFKDEPGSRRGILAPNERIAYWLSGQTVTSLKPETDIVREKVVNAYAFVQDKADLADKSGPAGFGKRVASWVSMLRWNIRRNAWRYAAAVSAVAVVVAGVSLSTVLEQLDAAQSYGSFLELDLREQEARIRDLERFNATLEKQSEQLESRETAIARQLDAVLPKIPRGLQLELLNARNLLATVPPAAIPLAPPPVRPFTGQSSRPFTGTGKPSPPPAAAK